jgi:uncharacterized protein YjbI with pentapeptide repeats
MDDAGESGASEQMPPRIKAEDNPWYLLATLFGVPVNMLDERRDRNRRAWNRYFAANLDDETRARLVEEKGYCEKELKPFSPEELQGVEEAFAKRKNPTKNIALPASGAEIDFSHVQFDEKTYFSHHIFTQCRFIGANFSDRADFRNSIFSKGVNFACVNFRDKASFIRAIFSSYVDFEHATFSQMAEFESATFFGGALFEGGVTFVGNVSFRSAVFFNEARFDRAIFERESEFANAKMKDMTSFEGATFKTTPPRFFGAELHEGTVWPSRDAWPIPKRQDDAKDFIRAYERLKLEMDRLKKHEDELDFFALELQSRRVLLGPVRGLPIAIYGAFSDYGRSYARPLYALFAVAAFGTMMLLLSSKLAPWQSPGLSIANTLNVFGFRKDFFDAAIIERLPAPLKILSAVQTILGTILLFLFGLGIRNKFRMK